MFLQSLERILRHTSAEISGTTFWNMAFFLCRGMWFQQTYFISKGESSLYWWIFSIFNKEMAHADCDVGGKLLHGILFIAREPSAALLRQRPAILEKIFQLFFIVFHIPITLIYYHRITYRAAQCIVREAWTLLPMCRYGSAAFLGSCWSGQILPVMTDWSPRCKESWAGRSARSLLLLTNIQTPKSSHSTLYSSACGRFATSDSWAPRGGQSSSLISAHETKGGRTTRSREPSIQQWSWV